MIEIGAEYFDAYEQFTLTHPEPDLWNIQFKDRSTQTFQRVREDHFNLPLARIEDHNHNTILFHYPALPDDPFQPWNPVAITESAGHLLRLHWNRADRLTDVSGGATDAAMAALGWRVTML